MATFTVEITPDSSNGTIAHATGKFSGGSSSYKGQRRMDVAVSGVGTFSALSPETSGGENTFSLDITGLTPGTTYNWSASLYYKNTSGGWVTAGSQYDKSGSFTTANSGTTSTVPLSTKAVGSIVKLKVNGTAKEFIVAHQGKPSSLYDNSCDGTWLLMKDVYENRVWQSGNINKYESSDIHAYLNNTFLNLFENNIKDAIKQVKIPYRKNGGSGGTNQSGANGLSCKIFLLSAPEVHYENSYIDSGEGAALSYFASCVTNKADSKRVAYLNGSAALWWLRSPATDGTDSVWYVYFDGDGGYSVGRASNSYGIRPALILPPDMEVDSSGNVTPPPPATHKTLINSTVYDVKGGKCLVNGTVYSIKKGRTLIGGTGYDIPFGSNKIKVTITAPKTGYASVTIGGVRYSSAAELEVDPGTAINCVVKGSATNVKGYIYRNGKAVGSSNAYSMTAEKDVSIELTYTTTISGSALIYHGQINITD